jgi:hypothetical protein
MHVARTIAAPVSLKLQRQRLPASGRLPTAAAAER